MRRRSEGRRVHRPILSSPRQCNQ
uniref:Uncharacterized protein n=1 Tax=Arundo donax TaxID=35708 RepID=A0A0A9B6B6_ARUDO